MQPILTDKLLVFLGEEFQKGNDNFKTFEEFVESWLIAHKTEVST